MRRKPLWTLLLIGLGCPVLSAQEERHDPTKFVAPYVGETTVAVVEIDAKNIDFDAVFGHLAKPKLATTRPEELAQGRDQAKQVRESFLRAGGRFAYVVVNMPQNIVGTPLPTIVVPAEKAEAREAIAQLLKQIPQVKVETRDGAVVAGPADVLQAQRQPMEVPQLAKAFAAVEKYPQRAAVLIPEALRRALEELAPELPKQVGGGSIKTVTRGLLWGAVGLDLSEKFKLSLQVQADSPENARRLAELGRGAFVIVLKEARLPAELGGVLSPKVEGARLEVTMDGKTIDDTLLSMIGRVREASSKAQSTNNLKQFALAFHNYHDAYKAFPPQASYDKQKKPLLSWRVHILPYVEGGELYKQFKLEEPWDSPHNKALIAKMPKIYRSPLIGDAVEAGKKTYLLPVGPKLLFNGPKAPKISAITDGTSNTILLVDADDSQAVYWTQPEDLRIDPKRPKAGVIHNGLGILTAFCDGSVRMITAGVSDELFWALLTPTGGEVIDFEKLR